MRIIVDYSTAAARGRGIGRYTRSLVAALVRTSGQHDFVLFSPERPASTDPFPMAPNVHPRVVPIGYRTMNILWHRARVPLPIQLFTGPADVLHNPNFTLPPAPGMRRIVTIHDLSFLTHPECAPPRLAAYLAGTVPRAARSADRVIAVSEHTARDLVERLGMPRDKIAVIHLAPDPMFQPVRELDRLARIDARYGLRHPLVLAVSTIEPRNNYPCLIAAFAQARRAPNGPQMLAISGWKGWLWEKTFEAVETHDVVDAVRFLDYVSESDLPALYSTADALAMPSLSEGFGLPLIEAMACGTPVVCSDGGALPEVAGEAAIVVPVGDEAALADALVRVVGDPALREMLIARGLERARAFTWERAAQAVLEVYRAPGKERQSATRG